MFTHNFVGLDLDRCLLVDPPADGQPASLIWSGGADRLAAPVRFDSAGRDAQRPRRSLTTPPRHTLAHWHTLAHLWQPQVCQDAQTQIA